jgi:predicted protein tyrosine phosphatase
VELDLVIESREGAEDILASEERDSFTHLFSAQDATDHFKNQNLVVPAGWNDAKAEKHAWVFDDIDRKMDEYKAVDPRQVADMIKAFEGVKKDLDAGKRCKVLVNCYAGISRSTAMAYVLLCVVLGPGKEKEAMRRVHEVRDIAFPNGLVIQHADELLDRKGVMSDVAERFRDMILRRDSGRYGW